jgi:hypothetical protein
MLIELDFVYPYHHSIGFLLEHTGTCDQAELNPLRSILTDFDFYLTHRMRRPKYSSEWRLFYPTQLDEAAT